MVNNERASRSAATISIVMATFNGEKYIEEQINSVLSQTILPDEIIVIDDCSKDATVGIIQTVLSNSSIPHKVIVHDKNMGVTKSFQDGIDAADKEYIMICDQDDVWLPNKIELTKEYFSSETNLVVCNAKIVDAQLNSLNKTMFDYIGFPLAFAGRHISLTSREMMLLSLRRNYVTGMCMAGKRRAIVESFPIPDTMTYDTWLAWNLARSGNTVFIEDDLVLYRQHEKNVVGTKRKKESLNSYYTHRKNDKKSFVKKYKSLLSVNIPDEEVKIALLDAIDFYEGRARLDQLNIIEGLKLIFKNIKNNRYNKYTGAAQKEMAKDLLEVVFYR